MSKSGKKNSAAEREPEAPAADSEGNETLAEEEQSEVLADTADEVVEAEAEPDPWAELTAERDLYKEKWLRVVAELDNVRKRASRELIQSRKFAEADVLRSFLEIQDNFERALQTSPDEGDTETANGFRDGVELIQQRLRGLLKEKGVEPMEVLQKEFNPVFHEAVGQLPREGVESGLVIEVIQQGYHFGDMVLRPARVIISA